MKIVILTTTILVIAVLAIGLFGASINSGSNTLAYAVQHEGNDTMSMGNDTSMTMNATLTNY